jgi:phosphoribosylanthranilate isomerase
MPTRIKICGLTRLEDARLAVELGAAALGFNFYPPSPRYIAPAEAREIIRQLPPFVMPIGIFADESSAASIVATARQAGVAGVQVHGPNYPALADVAEEYTLIVGVAVGKDFRAESLRGFPANAFLLDAFDPQRRGGTGRTFDWTACHEARRYGPLILAGGLTPENVGRAIREARPYAVDVASGIEAAPGMKDPARMAAFFDAVAAADRELTLKREKVLPYGVRS